MKRIPLLLFSVMLLTALAFVPATARAHPFPADSARSTAMPTQTTIRQQIVDEFKRRLAKIDSAAAPLANGYQYQTDIGKNAIDRWQTHYLEADLKAAAGKARLAVFDLVRTRTKDDESQKRVEAILPVQVRAYHVQELEPDTLTKMLADIQQAIVTDPATGQRDLQLNNLAVDIKPTEDGFIVPKETFQIDGLAVGFDIQHLIDPYGQ